MLLVQGEEGLKIMDEQHPVGERHDPRHVTDSGKDGVRHGSGFGRHPFHPEHLIDRHGQGSSARPGHEEVICQAVLAGRKTEPAADIQDWKDLAVEIDDAKGDGRRLGERRHGDHGQDPLDRIQGKGIRLSAEVEDDQADRGTR